MIYVQGERESMSFGRMKGLILSAAMAAALVIPAAYAAADGPGAPKEFVLRCVGKTGHHKILISRTSDTATYISDERFRVGKLLVTANEYRIQFPMTPNNLAALATINRNSGKMVFKKGTPPFGVNNKNNVVWTADCDIPSFATASGGDS